MKPSMGWGLTFDDGLMYISVYVTSDFNKAAQVVGAEITTGSFGIRALIIESNPVDGSYVSYSHLQYLTPYLPYMKHARFESSSIFQVLASFEFPSMDVFKSVLFKFDLNKSLSNTIVIDYTPRILRNG